MPTIVSQAQARSKQRDRFVTTMRITTVWHAGHQGRSVGRMPDDANDYGPFDQELNSLGLHLAVEYRSAL